MCPPKFHSPLLAYGGVPNTQFNNCSFVDVLFLGPRNRIKIPLVLVLAQPLPFLLYSKVILWMQMILSHFCQ